MTLPATSESCFEVQYLDNTSTWRTFGIALDLGTILRTRRFGPGPGQSVTAQHWRVVKTGTADLTGSVLALDGVAFWKETADLASAVKLYDFDFDALTQRYVLVSTPGNIEVYHGDVRQASIRTPWTAAEVSVVNKVQELDTFLGFHVATAPLQITRQGAHTEWDSRAAVFTNIPLFDYDGTRAGGVNEVQQIEFDSFVGGETFNITLEQFVTDPIVYSGVAGTMAANLTAALEALQNVGAGGVTVTNTATDTYSVEFIAQNRAEDIGQMVPENIHTTAGGVFAATLTQGVEGGEALWSALRGYPGCGCFYQQRLYMGGFASRPQTVVGSVIGDFFNYNQKGEPSDIAVNEDLDTDEAVIIYGMFPGRHLQVFTSAAEFFFPIEPITAPAQIKRTTGRGARQGVPQGFMDGATIFVSRTGGGLVKFALDIYQQTYSAPWLNVMAPDLTTGVVDMAFRRALNPKQTDQALLVRGDGLMAVMMSLLDQNVIGFTRWTAGVAYPGAYLAACGDIAGDMHVAVRRELPAGTEIFLEAVDPAAYTDHQVLQLAGEDPITSLTLPAHMEGSTVSVMIDGLDAGDFTVTDGAAALPFAALRQATAGYLFVPTVTSLPLTMEEEEARTPVEVQMRTPRIAMLLGPTASALAGVAGDTLWKVPLKRRPNELLDGADPTPFSGWTSVSDIAGFNTTQQVTICAPRPGPFTLRQLAVTCIT